MATKKTTARKPAAKVRDLTARKNPKGGAQKREKPALDSGPRSRTTQRASRNRLS